MTLLFEELENRFMLSADVGHNLHSKEAIVWSAEKATTIPVLHSLSSAKAKLYIDFDGDNTPTWGRYRPGVTPAFDADGDPSTFNTNELNFIVETWSRVSEIYSPFNIDVTTQDPGNLNDLQTARIVVGGTGSWAGGGGGIAYVGGFSNGTPNTGFVFSGNFYPAGGAIAEAIAHEAGHLFGLNHQSSYVNGVLVEEYSSNGQSSETAPIMGYSYAAKRALWWYGTSDISSSSYQDDMAIISSNTNGFGYKSDDYGDTLATAYSVVVKPDLTFDVDGAITTTLDKDMFKFLFTGGKAEINLTTNLGTTLDGTLEIYGADKKLIKTVDTASLGESATVVLYNDAYPKDSVYYIGVKSHGGYGDVGNYHLSVKLTKMGDATGDGIVDTTDYAYTDAGYFFQDQGYNTWEYGDFNLDGVIDGTDYSLLDAAYLLQ